MANFVRDKSMKLEFNNKNARIEIGNSENRTRIKMGNPLDPSKTGNRESKVEIS